MRDFGAGIDTIASAGSFLDGGANNPIQADVLKLLEPEAVIQEPEATQRQFRRKRDYVLKRLREMGIEVEAQPAGTFYVWVNLSNLPGPLNDGRYFLEAGLEEKVITVPGTFFDVNPERRREYARYRNYCRISFGPTTEKLEMGMDALARVIWKYSD